MNVAVDPRNDETLIVRCRGGSKTFDMTIVLLFYAAYGFAGIFWCSQASMMKQPKKYLSFLCTQTFLKYAIDSNKLLQEEVTFKNGGTFRIGNLTVDNARSPRADILYFDEQARADEDAVHATDPELSVSKLGKIIHGSTPEKGSVFEENYRRLESENKPILSRRWDEIGFINKNVIARERKTKPAWFFRQEYECSFEAPQGMVFTNVVFGNFNIDEDVYPVNYGVDWNPRSGHYLVGSRWNKDYTKNFAVYEENLGISLDAVFPRLVAVMDSDPLCLLEIEDGGTNLGYCDSFDKYLRDTNRRDLFKRLYRREWDSAGKNKMQSITNLLPITIMSRDSTDSNDLADWLGKAHWDAESDQPKLEKDPDQHALDSYLHSSWVGRQRPQLLMKFVSK